MIIATIIINKYINIIHMEDKKVKKIKIGFLDSGLGGITVLNEAMKSVKADYIYYGDNKNSPYCI